MKKNIIIALILCFFCTNNNINDCFHLNLPQKSKVKLAVRIKSHKSLDIESEDVESSIEEGQPNKNNKKPQ